MEPWPGGDPVHTKYVKHPGAVLLVSIDQWMQPTASHAAADTANPGNPRSGHDHPDPDGGIPPGGPSRWRLMTEMVVNSTVFMLWYGLCFEDQRRARWFVSSQVEGHATTWFWPIRWSPYHGRVCIRCSHHPCSLGDVRRDCCRCGGPRPDQRGGSDRRPLSRDTHPPDGTHRRPLPLAAVSWVPGPRGRVERRSRVVGRDPLRSSM
jgi:hypothetical protein